MIAVAVTDTMRVAVNVMTTVAALDNVSDPASSDLSLPPPSSPD